MENNKEEQERTEVINHLIEKIHEKDEIIYNLKRELNKIKNKIK